MKTTLLALVLVVTLVPCGYAQVAQGGGTVDAVKWVTNNTSEVTTDGAFALVPDMQLKFRSRRGPVLLHFCAETEVDPGQRLRVQGVVDGTVLVPSEVTVDEDTQGVLTGRQSHCVIFAGQVSPGWHLAEVEWRSDLGGQVFIDERSLVVQYLQ